ncbi:MAG: acyltransferase family protein [Sandarakinorhabdus sp.]
MPSGRRIGEIDGLRGYLALAVMGHHFAIWLSIMAGNPWQEPEMAFSNQLGKTGVGMFFMITGIVFYPRILAGTAGTNWISVYVGRIFRIVPLLLVMILIVTAIIIVQTGRVPGLGYPLDVASWVAGRPRVLMGDDLTRKAIGGVLWSIWFEWLFYLLVLPASAFARGMVGRRTWLVPVGLLVISLLGRLTPVPLFMYSPLFAFGMLAYEIRERPQLAQRLLGLVPAAIALLALAINMVFFHDPFGAAMPLLAFTFTAVVCGNSLFGLLALPGARMLGEISYGIYLLHSIVLYIGFKMLPDVATDQPWLALPVMTALVVAITTATYLAIERPGIAIGRALAARLTSKRASTG